MCVWLLTVFLLYHHSVADGQQTPELLYCSVPLALHQGFQLLIVELEFAISEWVPGIWVPLGDNGAQSQAIYHHPIQHTHPAPARQDPQSSPSGVSHVHRLNLGKELCFRIQLLPGGHT